MNRLQAVLLLVLLTVSTLVVAPAFWESIIVPTLATTQVLFATLPSLLGAVPTWVWWTLFGLAMSTICPLKMVFFARCGRATSCSSATSRAATS